MPLRSLICTIEGHVDHGKTSVLDKIRGSSVAEGEAGKITQAIGASIVPIEIIKKICGPLLVATKMELTIPGLLFIDTPGHAAFTNLRKRGGNLADIAVVVIDINEGIMPQTKEAIEILKSYKTPFVIAANKIDMIQGWQPAPGQSIIKTISSLNSSTLEKMEKKHYDLVASLSELGFNSERFDRVTDYTKELAIVPVSAKTGEGIPELLMVIMGLAQKYLQGCLKYNAEGHAKGIILEVKDVKGLGTVIDTIIYDGTLKTNDTIVIGGIEEPIITKVRALLQLSPLSEMREKKAKFIPIKEAIAATGVRISAPELECAIAGMPVISADKNTLAKAREDVQKEVDEVLIETDAEGIIVKADTLGSLEAMDNLLKEKGIRIRKATIGDITKKDISDAEANYDTDPLKGILLGFNVIICQEAQQSAATTRAKIITHNVIYKLIEDFDNWQVEAKKRIEAAKLEQLVKPFKVQIKPGYIFRQSHPAVFGVDVLAGTLKAGTPVMKLDGNEIGTIKSIQAEQETVEKAERGKRVAVSMDGVTVGRQANENDILISSVPENDFRRMKELKQYLSKDEIEILKEIAEIKRKKSPIWGI